MSIIYRMCILTFRISRVWR